MLRLGACFLDSRTTLKLNPAWPWLVRAGSWRYVKLIGFADCCNCCVSCADICDCFINLQQPGQIAVALT